MVTTAQSQCLPCHQGYKAPRAFKLSSTFQGANDGPARVAAKLTGAIPFPDPAHSKTAGGLPLASDTFLFQKQQHFTRGAFGHFEVTKDVSDLTKAHLLRSPGIKTPYPGLARNPRGFAVKFYTGESNYDIVGLNFALLIITAVFFCRDPIQGPDVIRSQYQNPQNFPLDHNLLFNLLANTPGGNHAGMMFFSDHGTPAGWQNIHGYGYHTFKWINAEGKFVYIKYHFLADYGQKQFNADEPLRYGGEDPDYSKRELWRTTENGKRAHLDGLCLAEEALKEFGKLTLNKNPENFHRDVEQAIFSPGSMGPGTEDSPDPYSNSALNCPFRASYSSLNFDGQLRVDANHSMNPQYAPNSSVHKFRTDTAEAPYQLADGTVSRKSHFCHEGKASEYDQPRELYERVMDEKARQHLHTNTARLLKLVEYPKIQAKYLGQLLRISDKYARGVYDLFPEKKFGLDEVQSFAKGAEVAGKEARFRPNMPTDKLLGLCAAMAVYGP
ncbi:catalase-like domain-containing protein [Aspergillus spinulosporus]